MVAFPLQNIYNHSFQPLWKAKKNATELPTIMESSTKKKNQKTKKAMELQEEDQLWPCCSTSRTKKYQTLIEICIMSWLEINISLPHPGRPKPLDVQNTGCPKTMDVQNPGCQNPGCPKPRCPNPGCLSVVQTMYVQTMDDTLPLACVCTFFLVTPVINNTPAQNKASH